MSSRKNPLKEIVRPLWNRFWKAADRKVWHDPYIDSKHVAYEGDNETFLVPKYDRNTAEKGPDGLPLPPRHRHSGNLNDYLKMGKDDVDSMRKILSEVGFEFQQGMKILEFGCASCRMLRWMHDLSDRCEIWGSDIDAFDIAWNKQNMRPPFKFVTNSTQPNMPFESGTFDLIYAGSIFTHIDELYDLWLLELRRILKPGGIAYITMHDDSTLSLFKNELKDHPWVKELNQNPTYTSYIGQKFAMFSLGRSLASQTFWSTECATAEFAQFFEVVKVAPKGFTGFQTAYVLRKPTEIPVKAVMQVMESRGLATP